MSKLRLPAIIVNFKTYTEATGNRAFDLAETCRRVYERTKVSIAVAPQFTDIAQIARKSPLPILSQHVDPVTPGSHTGHILPEAVKDAGAVGSLVNHSERRLPFQYIKSCIGRLRQLGMLSVVCADTPETCKSITVLGPDMVAIEPPELIGTGIPVSKAKPEVVTGAVRVVSSINPNISVLCGAGISSGDDVRAAMKLGVKGVLLASGVVKAEDPYTVLMDMANSILG